jgi:hypothetical protein
LGEKVVIGLSECFNNTHRLIAFDNYTKSMPIMTVLQEEELHGIGTVRPNRKDLPAMLKRKDSLKEGEFMNKKKSLLQLSNGRTASL